PSLEAIVSDRKSPATGMEALLLTLKVDAAIGSPDRQAASFERVRVLVDSGTEGALSGYLKARALLALAEAKLRMNAPEDAEQLILDALALQRRDNGSVPTTTLGALAKSLQ